MSDPSILFVKPKAISRTDKATLKTAGVIVIELDDPQAAKFIRAHTEIESTALLTAACKAIKEATYNSDVKSAFGRAICEHVAAMKI